MRAKKTIIRQTAIFQEIERKHEAKQAKTELAYWEMEELIFARHAVEVLRWVNGEDIPSQRW